MRAEDLKMTAGDRGGDGVGAGLDAVGDQIVAGAMQRIHPLHQNPMRADALNARSHRGEAVGEVGDFGIARRVQDFAFTPRQHRRHQRGLGRADRRRRQHDTVAAQSAVFGPRLNVTGLDIDLGAERLQRLEMQVDRPRADRAAAGQRHPRRTEPCQQRRQHQNAGAHAADEVVGRLRALGSGRVQHQHSAGTVVGDHAELAHQREHGGDVGHARNIAQLQRFGAEQRRGNLRQRRVLRAADLDRAFNASAAANDQPVHVVSPAGDALGIRRALP